jgi:uncharacterized protein (DUF2147 family)
MQASAAQAAGPEGVWLTDGGRSQISISRCGDNLCGTVVKLAEPYDAQGKPVTDVNNDDPAMRRRPLIGLRILYDFKKVEGEDEWQGQIYNPEDGDYYSGSFEMKGEGLEVEGCVAYIICQSQMWTRVK